MTYDDLIKHYGSQAAAGLAISVSQPSVSGWQNNGIPIDRQIEYEVATGGALKADLPKILRRNGKKKAVA